MRMFVLMYGGPDAARVPALLERHGVTHYTTFAGGHGVGSTGRREGTRAWPGETTMLMSVVPDEQVDALSGALESEAKALPAGERLHVAVLPIERFF
ncbi:MAG: hypothetical protein KF709_06595 [Gemmatimonadaceae bacterium]|nr:hypothetical protein [Gemmatimonadaceae bacterium]